MDHGQTFDFASHLHLHTGLSSWEVQELAGGAANYTVRARPTHKEDGATIPTRSKAPYADVLASQSVVFKQAPAFLAKSPDIPFSPRRQKIEAAALRLLHQSIHETPLGLERVLSKNPSIKVPRLLLHDITHSVIAQTDLGALPTLYDVLIAPDTSLNLASELGTIIGKFLADLHDAFLTSHDAFSHNSSLMSTFHNDDAELVIKSIIRQAATYMKDAGVPEYKILEGRALDHWVARSKSAFSQGDIWFGALLVDKCHTGSSDTVDPAVTIGVCDWEFAGPNHPAADIAQLGSYLHLLSLAPLTTPQGKDVVIAFSQSLYQTYFSTTSIPISREYTRSLAIMHGWEMINAAGWRTRQDMWCLCSGDGVKCSHIKFMVDVGAKLLKAAGDDHNNMDCRAIRNIAWARFFPIPSE